jgi:cell fate (sporulation/competence/biofilm development) regulator YlbF (YheA/YmcA/DUF963 family)
MIDNQLKLAVEEFVRNLSSSQAVKEFQSAQTEYQNNPDVKKMQEEYVSVAQNFQQKQTNGTLTQEDINVIRQLQANLNRHPAIIRYAQTQQMMVMMLQDCNSAISEMLGFDFAATAAPTSSC